MDNLTPEQRHKNMSHIRSKDTEIELILRRALRKHGYGYRVNYPALPGKPDIVLTKYKIAIFCDSEFFHGKDWEEQRKRLEQGNNADYWIPKIQRNIERDGEISKQIQALGYKVLRFWGKEIKKNPEQCIRTIEETIFDRLIEW